MDINELFLQFKKNNKFPNLLIVQTNEITIDKQLIVKNYLKSLICSELLFCDKCNDCLKVNTSHYLDLIELNFNNEGIKKEDIAVLQEKFMKASFERKQIKLYAINNFESVNKYVSNALLKFIEEPPQNTYAIFFTKNYVKIPPTIISRAYLININANDNKMYINNNLIDQEINTLANDLLNNNDEYNLYTKIKVLEYTKINELINELINKVSLQKKVKLLELNNLIKININKNLLAYKILEIIKCEQ